MNQPVAEAGHILQGRKEIVRHDTCLVEHFEGVPVITWSPEPFRGDDVIGQVNAGFDRDLQVMPGCTDLDGIGQELAFVVAGQMVNVPV